MFRVWGRGGLELWDLGFRVEGLGFRVEGLGGDFRFMAYNLAAGLRM